MFPWVRPQGCLRQLTLPRQVPALVPAAMDRHYGGRAPPRAAARRDATMNDDDINVLALVKGTERYIFLYDDSQRAETLRMLGRYASNPELSFSWYDAAVLSQKVRQMSAANSGSVETAKPKNRISLVQPSDFEE